MESQINGGICHVHVLEKAVLKDVNSLQNNRFNVVPIKIPLALENGKMEMQKDSQQSRCFWRRKSWRVNHEIGRYKATVIKKTWYLAQ